LRKEAKVDLYDWAEVSSEASRFENLVALHLLKAVRIWKARGEGDIKLCYLRDKEKREVDFVLVEKEKPFCLVECKTTEENAAPALGYFQRKLAVPVAIQLLHKKGVFKKINADGFLQWIISADRWLGMLP